MGLTLSSSVLSTFFSSKVSVKRVSLYLSGVDPALEPSMQRSHRSVAPALGRACTIGCRPSARSNHSKAATMQGTGTGLAGLPDVSSDQQRAAATSIRRSQNQEMCEKCSQIQAIDELPTGWSAFWSGASSFTVKQGFCIT